MNRERILMPGLFLLPQLKKCPCIPKFVLNNPELNDPKKFGLFGYFKILVFFRVFSNFFRLLRAFSVCFKFWAFFGYLRPFFRNSFSHKIKCVKIFTQNSTENIFSTYYTIKLKVLTVTLLVTNLLQMSHMI